MPIYEYRCQACSQISSFFLRSISSELEPICSHCTVLVHEAAFVAVVFG